MTLVDTGLRHPDRRAAEAGVARYLRGRAAFLHDLWRRCGGRGHRRVIAFHRSHGKLATVTAVQPPAALRRPRLIDGDACRPFRGEAARRRRLDQRRLLRAVAEGDRLHARRRRRLGARAAGDAGARRAADGLPPRRLLAANGHAARQAASRRTVGSGQAPWKIW